ncbi:hypothetical protein Ahy_A08g040711 isoform B [Arachis hypogaea]|uniref:Bifunctional inhibitor/plant lipid transfer protein/seed storage helical domain-containing protein n=1 Tax=Arachis hypogaea TaxID=3818 RepID=A0A445C040_ARAHY|nr:hypothetical protein Ahy_A08g040711 isoform B [Arachis hypogaea]
MSTLTKSCSKSQKKPQSSAAKEGVVNSVQKNKIRQRKFVVAKKNKNKKFEGSGGDGDQGSNSTLSFCKCKESNKNNKCLCVAYQNLRKSQEEFFKNKQAQEQEQDQEDGAAEIERVIIEEEQRQQQEAIGEDCVFILGANGASPSHSHNAAPAPAVDCSYLVLTMADCLSFVTNGSTTTKPEGNCCSGLKSVLKTAPQCLCEAFKSSAQFGVVLNVTKALALPAACKVSAPSASNCGLSETPAAAPGIVSNRTSNGGRRSRRNSLESTSTFGGSRWKKKQQLRVTSQKPFKLRTEERGKVKEEEFVKKIHEMMTEEEKQRILGFHGQQMNLRCPFCSQNLCLVKPPVKEITQPIDLQLHSDVRAMDRAEFDHQVAEKLSLIEQYKLEKERQQKVFLSLSFDEDLGIVQAQEPNEGNKEMRLGRRRGEEDRKTAMASDSSPINNGPSSPTIPLQAQPATPSPPLEMLLAAIIVVELFHAVRLRYPASALFPVCRSH